MQLALSATVAHGKQRSPKAGKRVDAADAQRAAFAPLGVLGQFQLCFAREGIVFHRCRPPCYEMIVEDLAELSFGEIRGWVERCVEVLQACAGATNAPPQDAPSIG